MSDFNAQHNRAVWFDIPVADLDRAAAFAVVTDSEGNRIALHSTRDA